APARTTMARNASVSVIIPTWNEAKYLPALLDSLQNQTRSPLEILIADSESTDGTQDLAEARGALLVPGDRRGPGEGRNRGARSARGALFLFVDADCVPPPVQHPAPGSPDVDAALPDVRLRPHDPEGIHRLDDPVLRDGPHVRRAIPPGAGPLTEPGYRALRPRPRRR